jgi:hypothetical protein
MLGNVLVSLADLSSKPLISVLHQTFEYLTGVSLFQLDPSSDADADSDKNTAFHLQKMMEITGEKTEASFLNQCSKQKQRKYFDPKTCELNNTSGACRVSSVWIY